MADAARKLEEFAADIVVPAAPATVWSGDVHGPVAALHQAIERGFATQADVWLPEPEAPLDRVMRLASRATGWLVLAAAFAGVAALIF